MVEAVENEFKLTTDAPIDEDLILKRLSGYLDDHGIDYSEKVKSSEDRYFDSKDMELDSMDCILRRKNSSSGRIKLTIKRPLTNDSGMMSRREIEKRSDGSFEDLCAFSEEQFPGIMIEEEPVLIIRTTRHDFEYDGIKLSFDICTYVDGEDTKDFHEIELESMDDSTECDFDRIGIVDFIRTLGFETTVLSKFKRGIIWKSKNSF